MSETALAEGSLIAGRYRLDAHLGEGGMGTVWSATHTVTRRAVAMKFLKDSLRHREDLRERFLREAVAASALKHPNVVEIIDVFDFAEGCPVMVMELLRGETLGAKLLRDERLSLEETATLLLPVLSAVGTAHALGIVHRDLKPDNLFLIDGARVKVLDFGIAKLNAERYLAGGPSALLTESGALLGTPCYMAPEQASGDLPVDHRADVWSLGVILYECLAGMRPIEGENLPQVVARLMSAGIMPVERIIPELPGEVSALVTQMLTREVSCRPPSLVDVSKVLSRYTDVRAPDFAAPSTLSGGAAKPIESARSSNRSKARVVASRDANPQGKTLLSAPPVHSSLLHDAKAERTPRRSYVAFAMLAVLFISIGWIAAGRKPADRSPSANSVPPMLPGPPESAASRATGVPAASPPDTSPAPVASAKAPPAQRRRTGQPVASAKATASTAPPVGDRDVASLFSGRK